MKEIETMLVEVTSNGSVSRKKGGNKRVPYEHQKDAMGNLNIIDKTNSYSTLVVLPTGGGKTYTASMWLLKHALDRHKKILWIAHRQMLLNQAAESFQKYAYEENLPNITEFNYRIVSGSDSHDRTIDIRPTDDLLIASKDSIGRNVDAITKWINNDDEIYLIIDEAHHSTAKTYRKIINHIKDHVPNAKIIGLTATPFRTAESEQGLLAKIYTDGVKNNKVVKGDRGITYEIGLKELIKRRILSRPIFESYYTDEVLGEDLGIEDLDKIFQLDILPKNLANQLVNSAPRNKLIVETYKKNKDEYGQTIVFAVNVPHAIALSKMFNNAGIKSEYVISNVKDMATGVTTSAEDNERKLNNYREGKTKVLVNVNILTEGVDVPQTQTVFLARPTVSTILMTQMIGRALRGEAAGGTATAHIVSFIDDWNEHIAWVNPESLFIGTDNEFSDNKTDRQKQEVRLIAISKIEEFASILEDSVDTSKLESVPFEKRIPIGMYTFQYLEENGMDCSYKVMVYDSTQNAYKNMMLALPDLFKDYDIDADTEYLDETTLSDMTEQIRGTYFTGEMIPPYDEEDIKNILRYYAQKESVPEFYTFDAIDRSKLDVSNIAKEIYSKGMDNVEEAEYVNSIWANTDSNMLSIFFPRKIYFIKQIEIELTKLKYPDLYTEETNVKYGTKKLEDLSLKKIGRIAPDYEKQLKDGAFSKSCDEDGNYTCAICGKKSRSRVVFQVDHIIPLNKGGKTISDNLQILCRQCNGKKGDK